MDFEHDYYQNVTNANRRPTKAFYLDVLHKGMGTYSREEVEECISAYHGTEEDPPSPATLTSDEFPDEQDLQAVGGFNWFSDASATRYYSEYDSEMEFVASKEPE
jgi:hypothetical protein